jgi:hypothetical protein
MIVDAGLAQRPSPPALGRFLARQGASPVTARALLRLLRAGQGEAVELAAAALLKLGEPMVRPFTALPAEAQRAVAAQLYAVASEADPAAVALLGAGNGRRRRVGRWLAQQLAKGRLPEPAAGRRQRC